MWLGHSWMMHLAGLNCPIWDPKQSSNHCASRPLFPFLPVPQLLPTSSNPPQKTWMKENKAVFPQTCLIIQILRCMPVSRFWFFFFFIFIIDTITDVPFSPPLRPPPPFPHLPLFLLSSHCCLCPWVKHVCSLANPFPCFYSVSLYPHPLWQLPVCALYLCLSLSFVHQLILFIRFHILTSRWFL